MRRRLSDSSSSPESNRAVYVSENSTMEDAIKEISETVLTDPTAKHAAAKFDISALSRQRTLSQLFSESLVRSRRRRDGLRARGHAVQRPQDHRLLHIIAAGAANSKKLSAVPSDSSCFRAARKDLPRRNRLEMPLVGNAQRSVWLNLPGLHSGPGDVKARIFCGLNVIEFRRVALARNFIKGAQHSSMSCIVSCHTNRSSRASAINT